MSQFKFEPGVSVKHLKTGGLYRILEVGKYEPTGEDVYIYRSKLDQRIWVRPRPEMEDGRFEVIDTLDLFDEPAPAPAAPVASREKAGLSLTPGALVTLFTDGACKGNPGRGGWGVLLQQGEATQELCGGEANTTNNRMELMAAIKGLQALPAGCQVELHTDSQYVQKGITEWITGWKRRNWKKADGSAVVNKDLWVQLDVESAKRRVTWKWVRGHNGHPGNEAADVLANRGVECAKA
jgi:ribonuclease HI